MGQFSVTVSFYEIYNDRVYDLLADQTVDKLASSAVEQKGYSAPQLKVSVIGQNVRIVDLNTVQIDSEADALALIKVSQSRRRTSSTVLNDQSSRSHAVFTINLTRETGDQKVEGRLTIVDLAGSEQLRGEITAQQKDESISINKSLSALSSVFIAMRNGDSHVRYRDSTLTTVLSEYFQGNNKVVMIACVNSDEGCYQESVNTLNFAQRIRTVSVKRK